MIALSDNGVTLFQQTLVAHGLRLGVLHGDVAALTVIAIELRLLRFAQQDPRQLVREVEGVVHAAVEAHASDRTVHMRGVAQEQHAADAERLRHPLVHGIEITAADLEISVDRQEPFQAGLHRLRPREVLLVFVGIGREMDAPAVRRPFPVEQIGILDRVGDVVALSETVPGEVVGNFDVERALGIGEAFELHAGFLARDAARAFRAREIAARDRFRLAGRIGHLDGHSVRRLAKACEAGRHPHVDERMRLRHGERLLDDLDALALQHERKLGVVLEVDMVELGDDRGVLAIPVLELRRHDPARNEPLVKTDLVEQLERRGMIAAGARYLVEEVGVGHGLDDRDRDPLLRQGQREAQAHRACADDDYGFGRRHGMLEAVLAAATSRPRL